MIKETRQHPARVFYAKMHHPCAGDLLVAHTGDGWLCRASLHRGQNASKTLQGWRRAWPNTTFDRDYQPQEHALSDQNNPLILVGTSFQCTVWRALLTIPAGSTISYGLLAERIGHPKAVRAVGTALGKNPLALILPCHRVIAANGTIGGFSFGPALKEKLITFERETN